MSSTDGINWTTRTAAASNDWKCVCWSSFANAFVAVSTNGTSNRMMKSTNGTSWTTISTTNIDATYNFIISIDSLNLLLTSVTDTAGLYITNKIAVCTSSSASSWTFVTTTYDFGFNRIIYADSLNLLVTCGISGKNNILTSSDGKNWIIQTPANQSVSFSDIVWSPSLSLIVCISTSYINRSSDGINWISSSPPSGQWYSITWSPTLNLFVAISAYDSGNNFMRSSNGYTWTAFNVVGTNWQSICWSSSLAIFLAAGYDGKIAYSSNGINWTIVTIADSVTYPLPYYATSVQWISQLSVFVLSHVWGYAISYDGINWINNSSFSINGVTYNLAGKLDYMSQYNVLIGCVTGSNDYRICYSYDAITWQFSTFPLYSKTNSFISCPQLNISLFYGSNTTYSYCPFLVFDYNEYINTYDVNYNLSNLSNQLLPNSTAVSNAISNYYIRTSAADNNWSSICWSPLLNLFVAVANNGTVSNNIMTSPDSINWSLATSPNTNQWTSICWSSELVLFVAVASSGTGNRVMTSPNGTTWTVRTSAADNNWTSVCWSSELLLFVAVASSGTGNRVMISPNGFNWTTSQSASDNNWTSICWAKYMGLFVAVASSGTGNRIMTSPDGITWTSKTSVADINWSSVCYNSYSNLLVSIATNSSNSTNVMKSVDGINWTAVNTNNLNNWNSICWSPELNYFIAVASSGSGTRIMTSSDGSTWTTQSTAIANNNWTSVCWSTELSLFVAVASSGTNNRVMTSNATLPALKSTIVSNNNALFVDQNNGRVGLGTQIPSYQLQLSSDSAAKPSTSTWTVSSDERLKENIQDADLNMCYNNIKNLKLRKYKWKDDVYTLDQVSDRSKLGWIAQEVETILPKSVEKHNAYGYEDCRSLNSDQIITSMYGCLKKLINIYDNQTNELDLLDTNLSKLQSLVDELTK
jgi:hypothetical protein